MDAGPANPNGAALWLSIPLLAAAQLWPSYPLQAASIWGLYGITALAPPGEALLKPLMQVPYYIKPNHQHPVCDTKDPANRTSSPAAHNQTRAVWSGESAAIFVPITRSHPKSVDTPTTPSSISAVYSSSDYVQDRDHVYSPIVTSPKVPIDIYTTSVALRPNDPAEDVPKGDIELHQMTERNPAPNNINHNLWGGYAIAFAGGAILAPLVLFCSWGIWTYLRRPTMGAVRRILQDEIPQRVQHWIGQVHHRFTNVGSINDNIQRAWQWLSSRFEHMSQRTSKFAQNLLFSKHHQSDIEARLWPISLFYGLRGQDPHSLVQRATVLFGIFLFCVFCLFFWFLPKVYSMLFPLGYAFQVWALVSSVISSVIYSTTTCLSQLIRCTKAVYYKPIYPDGSYIPLTTPSTFTGFVCRRIDLYIMFLRAIFRSFPLPGIWHGTEAIEHIRSAKRGLEHTTRSARHFIGCLPFFFIVSDYRCSFWANTLNRVLLIVLLIGVGILNCLAVRRWQSDQAYVTRQRMKRFVFEGILILGPFSMLAYFIWNIWQNLSCDEMCYVGITLAIPYVLLQGERTVDWWNRLLRRMRLAPAIQA